MPIQRCIKDWKIWWKWWKEWTCYTWNDWKEKADEQRKAIEANNS